MPSTSNDTNANIANRPMIFSPFHVASLHMTDAIGIRSNSCFVFSVKCMHDRKEKGLEKYPNP